MRSFDFQTLIENYDNGLIETLRDFNNDEDVLRLWVHDEDHSKSLINLFHSICEGDNDGIIIKYDYEKFNKKLNIDLIKKSTLNYGNLTSSLQGSVLEITFKKFNDLKNEKIIISDKIEQKKSKKEYLNDNQYKQIDLKEYYLSNIDIINLKRKNSEITGKSESLKKVSVTFDDTTLNLLLHPINSKIIESSIDCNSKDVKYLKFLDIFCDQLTLLPILEAKEHAIIKLENIVRPLDFHKHVKGIVLPIFISELFILPQKLLDLAYDESKKIILNMPNVNEYDLPVSKNWSSLSDQEKGSKINHSLKEFELINEIMPETIKLQKIEKDVLLTFKIDTNQDNGVQNSSYVDIKPQALLLKLESFLQNIIEKRIEVFYKEKLDINKLRIGNLKK